MSRCRPSFVVLFWLAAPISLAAQGVVDCRTVNASMEHATMDHAAHQVQMQPCAAATLPTSPGQAAFGAISEIVRILEADTATDWSTVNIEALRQHLIDMDAVTMRAVVVQRPVRGGFEADVTGDEQTREAIRRMLGAHSKMVNQGSTYRATATDIPGGARLMIVAADGRDTTLVARIRALGVAGMLTEGDHHVRHHLALARGNPAAHEH